MSTITPPVPRASRGAAERQVSLYTELARLIKEEDLLARRPRWYAEESPPWRSASPSRPRCC